MGPVCLLNYIVPEYTARAASKEGTTMGPVCLLNYIVPEYTARAASKEGTTMGPVCLLNYISPEDGSMLGRNMLQNIIIYSDIANKLV